ncbi:MAG: hypothetical protein JNJ46_17705 [Myxococcales bacterium]|nr:hypothetical protein [Myxococcales bacterium]
MSTAPDCFHRVFLVFLLAVLHAVPAAAAEPRVMPQPALLPHYSPLCDSNLVGCLDIDDFGAHAYAHLMVLPKTDQRDAAAVFPYGVTLGLFGRFAGGVATDFSFWQEGGALIHQHGPLRLNLTALLWPLLPLSQAPQMERDDDGATHYRPAHHLRIGLHYEQQVRVGPFSGANSLGLLTDLSALRMVASRTFGPIEITTSLGALYDWRGGFATGEAAAQLGIYLPFFRALKLYGEALGRGWPTYVKTSDDGITPVLTALLSSDGVNTIQKQSVLGLGLSFRPQARVDFGVSVQFGMGGLAPSAVLVRAIVLSVGKTYQGRAATPIAEIAADVTVEFARWIKDQLAAIDPYLKQDCVLYDDEHKPVMSLGALAPDGKSCIYDGLSVPIGPHFFWNKAHTRLCNDEALTDCFLHRTSARAGWLPMHPLLVQNDCFAYWQGSPWMRVGTPTPDGQGCENRGHVIPIGHELKQDRHHDSYYCYDELDKAHNQTQKKWCLERPDKPQSTSDYLMRRWAGGIDNSVAALKKGDDKVRQGIDEMAAGMPLRATTPVREAESVGQKILSTARNATREDAKHAAQGVLDAAAAWLKKPWPQKLGDAVESVGDAMASPTTYVPAAGILRTGGKLAEAVEHTTDAAVIGKQGAKAAAKRTSKAAADEVAEHTDEAAARRLLRETREAGATHRLSQSDASTPAKPPHGNRADDRPATRYQKLDKDRNLLKHGVTKHENPTKRYSKKEIAGGRVEPIERGPRREMLRKERELVETNPGPENREPWAGKRRAPQSEGHDE